VFELVRSRSRRGLVKEAIRALEEHLRWDKDRPWAVGYLGQLYEKTGDSATATVMYARYHSITGKSWSSVVE
jgi:predicted Zn-dependent protease